MILEARKAETILKNNIHNLIWRPNVRRHIIEENRKIRLFLDELDLFLNSESSPDVSNAKD